MLIRNAVPWSSKWVITYTFESPQWNVCIASVSKENYFPATSLRILSSTSMGQRLIKWSYQQSYREFIMCFMSPNSKDVWSLRLMWLSKTSFHWNRIWHTRHIPPKFSTNKIESRITRLLSSTRPDEMITLKMKARGSMRNSCDPTTLSFYAFTSILGRDSLLREEGCNTACYRNPNQSY
jgi:hypothetical protein